MFSDAEFRILVVDDNPAIHEDFKKILSRADQDPDLVELERELFGTTNIVQDEIPAYAIDSAMQGDEAVEKILRASVEQRPYSVAFVDMRMPPGIDGIQTIEKLWEHAPFLQVVICTAYSDYSWAETIKRLGCTDRLLILKKPFDKVEVCQLALAMSVKHRLESAARVTTQQLREMVKLRTIELEKEIERRKEVETVLRSSHDSLQEQAEADSVTGLLNRGAISKRMEEVVSQSRVTNEEYSILFVDIDRFKSINDKYGHLVGDEILKQVATILESTLRPTDNVGRFGGEEFLAVLRGCNINNAYLVAERIRSIVARQEFEVEDVMVPVTVSIGVAAAENRQEIQMNQLLENADRLMYQAKDKGRNRVETDVIGINVTPRTESFAIPTPPENFTNH